MTEKDTSAYVFRAMGEEVAVTHEPTSSTWRFKVERTEIRRYLVPRRSPDLPPTTKGMSVIKKAAFERAVAASRALGLID